MMPPNKETTSTDNESFDWQLIYSLLGGFLLLQIVVYYLLTRYFE
jgi:hypothetical protein